MRWPIRLRPFSADGVAQREGLLAVVDDVAEPLVAARALVGGRAWSRRTSVRRCRRGWRRRRRGRAARSLMRRPGIRNERGTQVGASRKSPSFASKTSIHTCRRRAGCFLLRHLQSEPRNAWSVFYGSALIARHYHAGKEKLHASKTRSDTPSQDTCYWRVAGRVSGAQEDLQECRNPAVVVPYLINIEKLASDSQLFDGNTICEIV